MKRLLTALTLAVSVTMAGNFTLKSSDLAGQLTKVQEFDGFGCTGKNTSPQLQWEGAPEGTKSFAVTMYDPDAPTGSGWWHWIVVNIPAKVHQIDTGASRKEMPKGVIEVQNDYGNPVLEERVLPKVTSPTVISLRCMHWMWRNCLSKRVPMHRSLVFRSMRILSVKQASSPTMDVKHV